MLANIGEYYILGALGTCFNLKTWMFNQESKLFKDHPSDVNQKVP
jgi:hypothetical protein